MKIAVMGTRGIPANYGGFETFAEELAVRLAARGHRVSVYGRAHYIDRRMKDFQGVRLVVLPSLTHKYLDTVFHTALSVLHGIFQEYDVVLICNGANAFFAWIPRVFGQKTVLNVDGIERMRKKWGFFGRLFYRLAERLATWTPNKVVTDAQVIRDYYWRHYRKHTCFIPYGSRGGGNYPVTILEQLGIRKGRFFLYVSRLEPENNADLLIQAYLQSGVEEIPLVVVGDAPYADDYLAKLRRLAARGNVIMPGSIYGEEYLSLLSHCTCYFQGSEVGGTHPALLEAMGAGSLVVCHGTPENREVLGNAGIICDFYEQEILSTIIKEIAEDPSRFEQYRAWARSRVETFYSWEKVTSQYESLFHEMVKKSGGDPDHTELC